MGGVQQVYSIAIYSIFSFAIRLAYPKRPPVPWGNPMTFDTFDMLPSSISLITSKTIKIIKILIFIA